MNHGITVEGQITDCLPGGVFNILLENSAIVRARPAGKLQQRNIRLIINDMVRVELSPYDLTKGRIVWRI